MNTFLSSYTLLQLLVKPLKCLPLCSMLPPCYNQTPPHGQMTFTWNNSWAYKKLNGPWKQYILQSYKQWPLLREREDNFKKCLVCCFRGSGRRLTCPLYVLQNCHWIPMVKSNNTEMPQKINSWLRQSNCYMHGLKYLIVFGSYIRTNFLLFFFFGLHLGEPLEWQKHIIHTCFTVTNSIYKFM